MTTPPRDAGARRAWFWSVEKPLLPAADDGIDGLNRLELIADAFRNLPSLAKDATPDSADSVVGWLTYDFGWLIWDSELPLENRVAAIRSTEPLFREWFTGRGRLEQAEMFWDIAIERGWQRFPGAAPIAAAILAQLKAQLTYDEPTVVYSALHGLNHLAIPEAVSVIDGFVARCADQEMLDYAEMAREFRLP